MTPKRKRIFLPNWMQSLHYREVQREQWGNVPAQSSLWSVRKIAESAQKSNWKHSHLFLYTNSQVYCAHSVSYAGKPIGTASVTELQGLEASSIIILQSRLGYVTCILVAFMTTDFIKRKPGGYQISTTYRKMPLLRHIMVKTKTYFCPNRFCL